MMKVIVILFMIGLAISFLDHISSTNKRTKFERERIKQEQERQKEKNELIKEYMTSAFTETIYKEIIMRKGDNQLYSVYVNPNEVNCHCVSGYSFLNRKFEQFDFCVFFNSFGFFNLSYDETDALLIALTMKLGSDYEINGSEIKYSYIEQYEDQLKKETIAHSGKKKAH